MNLNKIVNKALNLMKGKNMNKERDILKKTINDAQGVIDKAKRDLEALEVTYRIGDRFTRGSRKLILARCGSEKVVLVELSYGNCWAYAHEVRDDLYISQAELNSICNGTDSGMVRYWDAKKGQRV